MNIHQDHQGFLDRSERLFPGGGLGNYVLPRDVRFTARRAYGTTIEDTDGNRYLDFVCGSGANIFAFDQPEVIKAIQSRASDGVHFFGVANDAVIEFGEELVVAIPCAEAVIITTTGSEATAYAMRIARAQTGKDIILKFEGAYHGNQDGVNFAQFPSVPAKYPQANHDFHGVPSDLSASMLVAPYNDLNAVEDILKDHASTMAGIIVEPVQRVISPEPDFLAGLRDLCDRYGVLLIFDEVVTGFRLAYGGAQEYFGVTPDLACYGKLIGGGLPLGCVAGPADLIDVANPARRRGNKPYAYVTGNMHGDPLGCVAGLATLQILRAPSFYKDLNQKAAMFRGACQETLNKYDLPALAIGEGSLWQIAFTKELPKNCMDLMSSDLSRSEELDLALLRKGLFVIPNARRFVSAAHTEVDLTFALEALDQVCASLVK